MDNEQYMHLVLQQFVLPWRYYMLFLLPSHWYTPKQGTLHSCSVKEYIYSRIHMQFVLQQSVLPWCSTCSFCCPHIVTQGSRQSKVREVLVQSLFLGNIFNSFLRRKQSLGTAYWKWTMNNTFILFFNSVSYHDVTTCFLCCPYIGILHIKAP